MRKEMIKFEEINEEIILFDCYGSLLTEKQQEIFSLYYHENYSFGETSDINADRWVASSAHPAWPAARHPLRRSSAGR